MLLNTFDQVKEWIIDNGFRRWVLYKDYTRAEKIIDSAAFPISDQADKIAMTEKYLRLAGGKAYAAGSASGSQNELNVTTHIRLDGMGDEQQPVNGMQNIQQLNIGEIESRIRKQLKAEIAAENYEREKKAFEEEKKAFEEEKQSAIGALVHYFAPLGQMFLEKKMMRNVAGVDADEPVHAHKIQPIIPEEEQPQVGTVDDPEEEEIFAEEESEKLFELIKQWKAVEPDYLVFLEKIVTMAVNGDENYKLAKKFI